MAAIVEHARKDVAQRGITFRFAMPFDQDRGGNFDVAAKLFRGMATQEQAVKKCGFSLREVEVVPCFIIRGGDWHNGRIGYSLHQCSETKGNFTGSFSGVKWLGRKLTWFSEAKKCISPRAGSNSYKTQI
jgi:hypothetical protein